MNASSEIYTSVGMTDPLTEESSQDGSVFDDADLMGSTNTDIVAAQLASAGLAYIEEFICVLGTNSISFQVF
jgi:hypothetical protein